MADNTSRRGAADLGMLLMVLAFIVIGGFMYYLNVRAAEERALASLKRLIQQTKWKLQPLLLLLT